MVRKIVQMAVMNQTDVVSYVYLWYNVLRKKIMI